MTTVGQIVFSFSPNLLATAHGPALGHIKHALERATDAYLEHLEAPDVLSRRRLELIRKLAEATQLLRTAYNKLETIELRPTARAAPARASATSHAASRPMHTYFDPRDVALALPQCALQDLAATGVAITPVPPDAKGIRSVRVTAIGPILPNHWSSSTRSRTCNGSRPGSRRRRVIGSWRRCRCW